jgi:predicted GIY-YIG superfamily endonuclease
MKIHDNGIDRDMTAEEEESYLAFVEKVQSDDKAFEREQKEKAELKITTLAKLGLTAEEVASLLS